MGALIDSEEVYTREDIVNVALCILWPVIRPCFLYILDMLLYGLQIR